MPGIYNPAIQAVISGPYHVAADLFLDDSCQTFLDTAGTSGTGFGLTTLSVGFQMMAGDVVSWKIRFDGCPETDCLTAVAGTDICEGF